MNSKIMKQIKFYKKSKFFLFRNYPTALRNVFIFIILIKKKPFKNFLASA